MAAIRVKQTVIILFIVIGVDKQASDQDDNSLPIRESVQLVRLHILVNCPYILTPRRAPLLPPGGPPVNSPPDTPSCAKS